MKMQKRVLKHFKSNELYPELVHKFLSFAIDVLSPVKIQNGSKTISKL